MRNPLLAASAALLLGACADATAPAPPRVEGRVLVEFAPVYSTTPLPQANREVALAIHATVAPITRAFHDVSSLASAEAILDQGLAAHTDAATRPIVVITACQHLLQRFVYPDGVTDDERPAAARCAERMAEFGPQAPVVTAPLLDALAGYWPEARIRAAAAASLASVQEQASKNGAARQPSATALAKMSEALAASEQKRPAREAAAAARLEVLVAAR